jgi:C4-dicarboxylate-specific signal transduction histidine kinase
MLDLAKKLRRTVKRADRAVASESAEVLRRSVVLLEARQTGVHSRQPAAVRCAEQCGVALERTRALLSASERLSSTGSFAWLVARGEVVTTVQVLAIFEIEPGSPISVELLESRVHAEDLPRLRQSLLRAREAGGDFEHELRLTMPNHAVKHVRCVARAARDAGGELEYVGAVHDVTERGLAQAALEKVRSELVRVARAMSLGMLTASIAHEINQPLTGIVTNASTCLRMLASEPPNLDGARETARRAIQDGLRAAKVTRQLHALFSQKEVATESVDLNEATRDVIALSSRDLRDKQVELKQELASDLPRVRGDHVQVQQVVLNLLLNATDAMSGVADRPKRLLVRTEREGGDGVRLTVRDSGVGFEPRNEGKLFDPFYTTKASGMGIGLSISRSIIEGLGGRLWATLNDGPGATFSFTLRAWHGDDGGAGSRSS